MDAYRDQTYLLNTQYKDATNLGARINLHRRFSVNKYGWHNWVFDQFKIDADAKVLELGCGPGVLWSSNQKRIPASWHITLTDFSPGMLQEAHQRLGEERFTYQVADAQILPFAANKFDAVIANHMLYHVPDLPRAFAEIQRVLKPTGRFYATTFGLQHMHQLDELIWRSWPNSPWKGMGKTATFTLENGTTLLNPFFTDTTLHNYKDVLEVTEAEPLIAYVFSSKIGSLLSPEMRETFINLVHHELAEKGSIHITNNSGLFAAKKA